MSAGESKWSFLCWRPSGLDLLTELMRPQSSPLSSPTTFLTSLPSRHLWPQRESAKQILNWSLHLAERWNNTNSEDSPLLRMRSHCSRHGQCHKHPRPFWSQTYQLEKPASPIQPLRSASTLLLKGLVFQLRPRLPYQCGLVCVLSQGRDILQFWDLCLES